jgi:hypothetical protein
VTQRIAASKFRRAAAERRPAAGASHEPIVQIRKRRRVLPRFTRRLSIGDGLQVSPFCLGMTDNWRLIPAAFEMGINFFFITTDMHWPLYEASRKGMKALLASRKAVRDEIAVAGACYLTQPEFLRLPFQELVDAVPGMLRVDVLVAGGVQGPDLLERAGVLRRVAADTQARAVGASFHDRGAALAAANHDIADICYVRYNPLHAGARRDLLPLVVAPVPPLFNFKSTRGFLSHDKLRALGIEPPLWLPEVPDYYRYALSRPRMDGLLFSVKRRRELIELDEALAKGGLTEAEESHLDQLAILSQSAGAGP